jgi:succinate-semialdehyde dehydrogenase/glutarate-semialdehyde dehydrogenase
MTIESINPATGRSLKAYDEMSAGTVAACVNNAHLACQAWRKTTFGARATRMRAAAGFLRQNSRDYAELMAREMGKPVTDGHAEIEKCAWVCEHYAEHAQAILQPEVIDTDADRSYVTYQPLGVVLAVMPWNYPFWQVFRCAAPALMAGNAVALKHASNVTGCALAIESVFRMAGFPEALFQTLVVRGSRVDDIVDHPLVRGVSLTGSTEAGRSVGAAAGRALKKVVLELGGSDPYIILDDADLASAVEACVTSRLLNSGQSCIAAKRFIVVRSRLEEFETEFCRALKRKVMGDPMDPHVDIGPQARYDLRDDLHRQVRQSVEQGARILLGGDIPQREGAYYPPTVLTNVQKGMAVCDEETFGPVAAVIAVDDEKQAVAVANDSLFGLGAAVFTLDTARGERLAREAIDAGTCCVNTFVRSDPRLPFGGIKESGLGRELSHYGIKEFTNIKTVYIA